MTIQLCYSRTIFMAATGASMDDRIACGDRVEGRSAATQGCLARCQGTRPVTIIRARPRPVGDGMPISRQPCRRRPSMKDESADDHGLGFPPGRLVHRTSKTARASRRRVGFLDQTAGNMTPHTTAKTIITRRTKIQRSAIATAPSESPATLPANRWRFTEPGQPWLCRS